MRERLLLNLLFTLTPVFAYQLIMFHRNYRRDSKFSQYMMGLLSGVAAVICMMYPVVEGTHFLWDLRWTSFLLAITYGGVRGGLVCVILMVAYRAALGGSVVWTTSFIAAIVLFPLLHLCGKIMRRKQGVYRLLFSTFVAASTYILMEFSIFISAILHHHAAAFFHRSGLCFTVYGTLMVLAYVISVVLIESIFKQVEIRQELNQAEKVRLVGELAASFAHEIRNPLTVAKGFVQLVGESLTCERKNHLELVVTELDRAESIISDYLNLAKPQATCPENLPIMDALHSLVELMSPYAVMHHVELECIGDTPHHVFGDARQVRQLLMNLVKNAIEAEPSGGNVQIAVSHYEDAVVVTVRDHGPGMSEQQLKRLGNPFYSTKTRGTGLGLMVSYRLIAEMGGKIHFDSTLGVGTTAYVHFPIVDASSFVAATIVP